MTIDRAWLKTKTFRDTNIMLKRGNQWIRGRKSVHRKRCIQPPNKDEGNPIEYKCIMLGLAGSLVFFALLIFLLTRGIIRESENSSTVRSLGDCIITNYVTVTNFVEVDRRCLPEDGADWIYTKGKE